MRARDKYLHILFDLDHTLWDYESNSRLALEELFSIYELGRLQGLTTDRFVERFFWVNESLWEQYDNQEISSAELRQSRFHLILNDFGLRSDEIITHLSADYLKLSPTKSTVMPYSFEILDYLKPKYQLHIITNGFYEIQFTKLSFSGLSQYFDEVVTSEEAGSRKPHPEIFRHTLDRIGASSEECIMIGDNLKTDIQGARNAAIDHVFFNPSRARHHGTPTHEIASLLELKEIL